ncbi:uncharacterized protein LOC125242667 [Leguminivora glycinivorella]|uniref:uncharacterized protein LOC125235442 n=1 Tax=Leguminivora glycinivorella TaxID=1035111 RepID=UPI0020101ECA|nr:uncharacterized protein LOC125235442 [Leguminivora glycinivorella]XP_047999875.1 uncharacterized protein LOC125237004 isoform X2 [Leguminivora glycinivorella]XP_048002114.1 uncharacterized protein LOC125238735 isoform X2 [Leguminivora glycinivorella]XP_048005027.1 uncharacterized protein LOC125240902 isoform X3 [Leguminivora glycinivorella]XP_048007477.1 uncharacterized protein LOC125242667 [Leguminivora glycinivorella]
MSTETETLKKLRVKRSQCKGTITRIENFVQDPVSLAAASADILEARKEKLISTLKDYEKVQMDILGIDEGDSEQGHNTLLHQERNVSVDKPTIVDVSAHPPSPDAGLHKN